MPKAEGPPGQAEAVQLRVCIDVDDISRALDFYSRALGLRPGRRQGNEWAELLGATVPVDLLAKAPGTTASPAVPLVRSYARHWTPVHLDVVVAELDTALARALACGATLEQPVQVRGWGRMANLADPFGHGFCLLEFEGKGYDALLGG